jgi:hypothetical protein
MKKLIAILVVFALVAGAVFAQEGSWSVGGNGEIGTMFNFVPDDAIVGGHAYNRYDWYGDVTGSLSVNYSQGGLNAGINFNTAEPIGMGATYDGGDFMFQVEQNFEDLLFGSYDPGRLWGWYKLMDEQIFLEAAVRSRDTNYWVSNEVAGDGFVSVDGHNYFLTDFSFVDGLSFGFLLPGIFTRGLAADKWQFGSSNSGKPGYHASMGGWSNIPAEWAFKNMVIGAKYDMDGINAAFQIKAFQDDIFELYAGAGYQVSDQLNVGASFQGKFVDDANVMKFGVGVGFSDGDLKAGLEGRFTMNADDTTYIEIMPSLSYNVVPTHLAISLNAWFGIGENSTDWEVTPTLWYNFMGTGAGNDYWWPNQTAMIVRYKINGNSEADDFKYNALDITFKWSF